MKFTKMQGCGNDYIYVDGSRETVADKPETARRLSDRHFGIGADGVIYINPSKAADFEMEMYNADGSRGAMCGNGIRCVAKYVYDKRLTDKNPLTIESMGSVKTLCLTVEDGIVTRVRVDMGEPILTAADIPADPSKAAGSDGAAGTVGGAGAAGEATEAFGKADARGRLINVPYLVNGALWHMTAVSMGNPHAVVYVEDTDALDLPRIGAAHERHPVFPDGVNTEFIQVLRRDELKMRVWERGSGETLACGTGACAAVVSSVLNGHTDRRVVVHLLGGDLDIEWSEDDNHVYMTGPATTVFEGEV